MNTYRIQYTRPYISNDSIHSEIILATDEQQARDIFADCEVLSVELDKQDFDAEMESQKNAAKIWAAEQERRNMTAARDYIEQVRQEAEIAADTEWLGEVTARQYGDADLTKPRMIVTKSFAGRWTDNPDHYREHFGIDDVEVQG